MNFHWGEGVKMSHASDLRKHPAWAGMLLAGGSVAATLLLRLRFGAFLDDQPVLILFVLPILVSAYFGGINTGLAATIYEIARP